MGDAYSKDTAALAAAILAYAAADLYDPVRVEVGGCSHRLHYSR